MVRWTQKILHILGWKRASFSVLLVNDSEMKEFHLRYLGENETTDVLAFGPRGGRFPGKSGKPFLGDVVISVETARRRAPEFGHRWDEELLLYLCHGILHLMGYRDKTVPQQKRMRQKEAEVLKKLLGTSWPSEKPKPLF